MPTPARNNHNANTDDFNPDELVKEHGKDIGDIKERLEKLESTLGTNEKIADTLCETANTQTKMHEMLSLTLTKVLRNDGDAKKAIGTIIDDHDRNKLWWLSGKIGIGIWSIFLVVLTWVLAKLFP